MRRTNDDGVPRRRWVGVALVALVAWNTAGCTWSTGLRRPPRPTDLAQALPDPAELRYRAQLRRRAEWAQRLERYLARERTWIRPELRTRIAEAVAEASVRYRLDPWLILAVIEVESAYRPRSVSYAGALGLMQLLPYVAADVARRHGLPWRDRRTLFDVRANVLIGSAYLAELQARFGALPLALAAYNAGPTLVESRLRRGWRPPVAGYVAKVTERYRRWRRLVAWEEAVAARGWNHRPLG